MHGSMEAQPAMTETEEPGETAEATRVSSSQIRTASLRKEGDGHYWATARVNGVTLKFLVDTGATLVALTTRDARRIGLDTDKLERNIDVRTASGHVKAAGATIGLIEIDGVKVDEVSSVVIEEGLEYSLLGMSFLNRLESWDVTPRAIIIHD